MLFENWYFSLLRGIPETIAMIALGTALVRKRLSILHIIAVGMGVGIINFFLQLLPIQYGVHIPFSIIIFILVMIMFLKLSVIKSAAATLLSFVMLIVIETIVVFVQIKVLGYDGDILERSGDLSKFLFSLPSLLILCIFAAGAQIWLRFKYRSDVERSA